MSIQNLANLLPGQEIPIQNLKGKKAIITGASSGIGLACAIKLAQEGCHLNLVARRKERLETIKKEILEDFPQLEIQVFAGDINDTSFRNDLLKSKVYESSDILVNNAGLAKGADSVAKASEEDWETMIHTNMLSAFHVTKKFVESYKNNKRPVDIIHLGSTAAHYFYEGGSAYCASKVGFKAFHQSLRQEEVGEDIRCVMVSPGHVRTEFGDVRFSGDNAKVDKVYEGFMPLSAYDIANQILFALKQPRHVNIHEILSMSISQASAAHLARNGLLT